MSLVISAYGLEAFLNIKATYAPWGSWTIHLYQNDYTPTVDSVPFDFTRATFDGYVGQPFRAWGVAAYNPGPPAQAEIIADPEALILFTPTGVTTPNNIYGFYVVDSAPNLIFAERNPDGVTRVGGDLLPYVIQQFFAEQSIP